MKLLKSMSLLFLLLFFSCGEQADDSSKKSEGTKEADKKEESTEGAFTTLDGNSANLDNLKGKVVLIDFWATWCPPCKAGMPTMQAISKQYEGKDFVMIGVSLDNKPDIAADYVKKNNFTYTFWFGKDKQLIKKRFEFQGIPALFLLDKEGKTVWNHIGFNASDAEGEKAKITAEIDKYLK
ncbi:MAG: TlpA family protein disulfide reductase [Candidatus Coatesbacteria bacterium]|nr:TlpA family protein disulfide reductase [Candidatus Coatesbacteria bacterium]